MNEKSELEPGGIRVGTVGTRRGGVGVDEAAGAGGM